MSEPGSCLLFSWPRNIIVSCNTKFPQTYIIYKRPPHILSWATRCQLHYSVYSINFNIIPPSVTRSSKMSPFLDIFSPELRIYSLLHEDKYTIYYEGPYYVILSSLLSLPPFHVQTISSAAWYHLLSVYVSFLTARDQVAKLHNRLCNP